ncbi:hypothetical protein [Sorangium sp. So ce1335]|uniref:hypothetical protein n=1 Tax=Sorangium sp. So ce1335 TaxID=3133335 RepID=UPI003F5F2508
MELEDAAVILHALVEPDHLEQDPALGGAIADLPADRQRLLQELHSGRRLAVRHPLQVKHLGAPISRAAGDAEHVIPMLERQKSAARSRRGTG